MARILDKPQDADSAGNEDVESVAEYPIKTPGVVSDNGNAELTRLDPDFAIKPTGVDMDSDAQGYFPEEHTEVDGLRQLKIPASILKFQMLNQLLSQTYPVAAQHKLHCPRE